MKTNTNTNHDPQTTSQEPLFTSHGLRPGIALIWTAITLLMLILFVGLALDWAKGYLAAHQLQNAADAAALAGAQLVKHGSDPNTRTVTYNLAHANYYVDGHSVVLDLNPSNDPAGDIVIGNYDLDAKVFYPDDVNKNAVKVVARCTGSPPHNPPVSLIFGPIAGVKTVNIERYAIAISSGSTGAGLITLDRCEGLSTNGTKVDLDVNDGAIQINADGTCGDPFDTSGKACPGITATAFNVVEPSFTDGCLIGADFPVNPGVPRIEDPLCPGGPGSVPCLPEPTAGIFHTGLTVNNGQTLTLEPGVVHIFDGGLNVKNGGTIIADGVMLFIRTGALEVRGRIVMTPPESGTYEGVSIFQSRTNYNEAIIISSSGASGIDAEGTLYFPSNKLSVTSNDANTKIGNQLIVGSLDLIGNSNFIVNYDGRNPAPGYKSYLVK